VLLCKLQNTGQLWKKPERTVYIQTDPQVKEEKTTIINHGLQIVKISHWLKDIYYELFKKKNLQHENLSNLTSHILLGVLVSHSKKNQTKITQFTVSCI